MVGADRHPSRYEPGNTDTIPTNALIARLEGGNVNDAQLVVDRRTKWSTGGAVKQDRGPPRQKLKFTTPNRPRAWSSPNQTRVKPTLHGGAPSSSYGNKRACVNRR